jgi:cobaltochelatase CobN
MILFLSTADTDLLTLSHALGALPPEAPSVRGVNPATLGSPDLADRYLDRELAAARVVVLRLLGGKRAFEAGFERLVGDCAARGIPLIAVPGDQTPDLELQAACTAEPDVVATVFDYLLHGGVGNLANMVRYLSDRYLETPFEASPPVAVPWEGLYHPDLPDGLAPEEYLARRGAADRPTVGLLFYRAHWMSRNLQFVDALIRRLEAADCTPFPVFCYSLKGGSEGVPTVFRDYLIGGDGRSRVNTVVNTLSFSMGQVEVKGVALATGWSVAALDRLDVPVIQAIVSTSTAAQWDESASGLSPIDTAMNVAMPEFDGRIIGVPISFKQEAAEDQRLGARLMRYAARPDRVDLLARLAANWARLRRTPNRDKRVALILSNYPTRNARIGNAVGLDTPASVLNLLRALRDDGYSVGELPESGDALIHALIDRCSYDRDFLTEAQMAQAPGRLAAGAYGNQFARFTDRVRD